MPQNRIANKPLERPNNLGRQVDSLSTKDAGGKGRTEERTKETRTEQTKRPDDWWIKTSNREAEAEQAEEERRKALFWRPVTLVVAGLPVTTHIQHVTERVFSDETFSWNRRGFREMCESCQQIEW